MTFRPFYCDSTLPQPSDISFQDVPDQTETVTAVNDYLARFFDAQLKAAAALDPSYAQLWQDSHDLVMAGGKRLRPFMTVLSYKLFGGRNDQAILMVATAQELLHAALLMHDDIIDRDTVRYGRLNVAGTYRQRYQQNGLSRRDAAHYSTGAALLAGDLLLTNASALITESSFSDEAKLQAQRCLQAGVFRVAGGELIDMESTFTPWQDVDPFVIATLKTASYSFESPLLTGALLADAPAEDARHLQDFARHAGIAFQLTDDVLGVFGNDTETGKSNTSDLEEGKMTLMLQHALREASDGDRAFILENCGQGAIGDETAERIRDIIRETGAKDHIERLAAEEITTALDALHDVNLNRTAYDRLSEIVTTMVNRSH